MRVIYLFPSKASVVGRRRSIEHGSVHLHRRALMRRLGCHCSSERPAAGIDQLTRAILAARI